MRIPTHSKPSAGMPAQGLAGRGDGYPLHTDLGLGRSSAGN